MSLHESVVMMMLLYVMSSKSRFLSGTGFEGCQENLENRRLLSLYFH